MNQGTTTCTRKHSSARSHCLSRSSGPCWLRDTCIVTLAFVGCVQSPCETLSFGTPSEGDLPTLQRMSSPIGKARDFGKMGLEIMPEPVDERIRLAPDAFGDVRHRSQ